jgi:hypothetical protein
MLFGRVGMVERGDDDVAAERPVGELPRPGDPAFDLGWGHSAEAQHTARAGIRYRCG